MRWEILILAIVSTLLGAWGALFLKRSNPEPRLIKLLTNTSLGLGLGLYGVSTIVFIFALKFGELTIVYPLTSLTYVWITIISKKFLNERISVQRWLGIGLIITGIALMNIQ